MTFAAVTVALAACTPTAEEQRAAGQKELTDAFAPSFAAASGDYEDAMRRVRTAGQEALAAQDRDAVVEVYRNLRDASRTAADAFEDITAPVAVRERQQLLVTNLRQQSDALDGIVTAATAEDDAALTAGLTELASLLADFTTIHSAIDQELAQGP